MNLNVKAKITFGYISDNERYYNDELFDPVDLAYYTMEGISSDDKRVNTLSLICNNSYSGRPGTMLDISRTELPYNVRNKLNHGYLKTGFDEMSRRYIAYADRW